MKQWEPMFMDPEFKETVWGGTRIMSLFSKRIPSAHTGESWVFPLTRTAKVRSETVFFRV